MGRAREERLGTPYSLLKSGIELRRPILLLLGFELSLYMHLISHLLVPLFLKNHSLLLVGSSTRIS